MMFHQAHVRALISGVMQSWQSILWKKSREYTIGFAGAPVAIAGGADLNIRRRSAK